MIVAFASVGLVFLGTVLFVGKIVLTNEYPYWGPALAEEFLNIAVRLEPKSRRDERRDEWAGELDAKQREQGHAGVMFAATLVVAAVREGAAMAPKAVRVRRRLRIREPERSLIITMGPMMLGTVISVAVVTPWFILAGAATTSVGHLLFILGDARRHRHHDSSSRSITEE